MKSRKKLYIFTIFCLLLSQVGFSQAKRNKLVNRSGYLMQEKLSVTAQLGLSSYYGDLCDKFDCMQFRPNFGIGMAYRFNPNIYGRAEINYVRLASNDVHEERNLDFRSGNLEAYVAGVYDYYPYTKHFRRRKLINPYAFAGFGITYFNPYGSLNGRWYKLRPLHTEGKSYSPVTAIIPVGFGFRIKYSRQLEFMVEGGYRFTFTDYLDDVSSYKFLDDSQFSDPVARDISNKIKTGNTENFQRGNPKRNDGYFVFQVKARYTFVTNINNFRGRSPRFLRKTY
jgi:hypothetical protein